MVVSGIVGRAGPILSDRVTNGEPTPDPVLLRLCFEHDKLMTAGPTSRPMESTPMHRSLKIALAAAGLVIALSACTPREIAVFGAITADDRELVTDAQLRSLRACESGGRYDALSPGGAYRGAYQFSQGTWDSVAARNYPWLGNRDPATVEWWWQDAMARALYAERGWSPWPHCGARL
jgi:hypothetical protein